MALPVATESVLRSRWISGSICAGAAMTVQTVDPIGVAVFTSPVPSTSIRHPTPLPRNCPTRASMFGEAQCCPQRDPNCSILGRVVHSTTRLLRCMEAPCQISGPSTLGGMVGAPFL